MNGRKKKLYFRRIILLLILATIIVGAILAIGKLFSNDSEDKKVEVSNTANDEVKIIEAEKLPPRSFTLTGLGDAMCHNTQYKDAFANGTYDFNYVFENVKDVMSKDNLTIGNLETTFAGPEVGYSGYPTFNTPDAMGEALKNAGVDVLSTANNHCLDKGYKGLSRTLDVLDQLGIDHAGTSRTLEEQAKVLIKDVNGIKVAILSFTYGTNGINPPSDKGYCVNYIDKNFIKGRIDAAKAEGAEVVIACMHWGIEYQTKPSAEQIDMADFLFKSGADIILGNHAHVIEPFEKREIQLEDGTTKDGFVVYAMGNLVANQNQVNTKNNIMLHMKVTLDPDNKLMIDDISYTPVYIYKNDNVAIKKFKLLKIDSEIANYEAGAANKVSNSLYNTLKAERGRISKILGE